MSGGSSAILERKFLPVSVLEVAALVLVVVAEVMKAILLTLLVVGRIG